MAQFNLQANKHTNRQQNDFLTDDDEEDEDSFGANDGIRRSYHLPHSSAGVGRTQNQATNLANAGGGGGAGAGQINGGEPTIHVTLNESYFANERRLLINSLANVRQKLNSLKMFNPAKNENLKRQQQEQWSEKEKYTLDSLNEFRGQLDERFQWNRPEDGREVWPSKLQYFLAITSYSIGLGNVIRFPILVQKNGGLAFIIPFVIMLLLEGIPLFYLELAIGQRMRKAAISCWHSVSPFAAGIGLASAAVSFHIGLYYNTMVAWTLIYTWSALWSGNRQGGSSSDSSNLLSKCQRATLNDDDETTNRLLPLQSGNNQSEPNECQHQPFEVPVSSFETRWYEQTLKATQDVSDWSHFNWPVALCLTLAWLVSYAGLVRGLSSSKRLVYIISIFPYVILVVFLFKAINLPGMNHGLSYLFEPDWPKLLDPYVWLQAAAQVFFSLGLGFGGLIALSSYNAINNNCYKDAIKVTIINFLASMLAGVVIFAILGFKANLNYDRCQLEREQQIDFYLADYNLKVLDYGAVFKQVPLQAEALERIRVRRQTIKEEEGAEVEEGGRGAKKSKKTKAIKTKTKSKTKIKQEEEEELDNDLAKDKPTTTVTPSKSERGKQANKRTSTKSSKQKKQVVKSGILKPPEFMAERKNETSDEKKNASATIIDKMIDQIDGRQKFNETENEKKKKKEEIGGQEEKEDDEFSAEDAIASINNLDRQLDLGSSSGSFDYGDSDTEFVLNASNLISRDDLNRIVESINNLQRCSIKRELEATTQGTGLVFVVIAEAISEFDEHSGDNNKSLYLSSSSWAILFFLMILALGLDSQFGNLEGLLSSLTDLEFFHLNSTLASSQNNNNNNNHHHHHLNSSSNHLGNVNGEINGNNLELGNGLMAHPATITSGTGTGTGVGLGATAAAAAASGQGRVPLPRTIGLVRQWATGVICLLSLALSIGLFAHGAGSYVFAIFDEYASNFSLILIALCELLAISHIYGLKRFCDDCELMTGKRPPFVVLLSWRYISPILLLVVVFTTIKQFTVELNYEVWSPMQATAWPTTIAIANNSQQQTVDDESLLASHMISKTWPTWAITFGACLIVSCVIWIPLVAILRIMRINLIPENQLQQRCWFPAEELKEFHQLQDQEHRVTKWERILFGFNPDDDD